MSLHALAAVRLDTIVRGRRQKNPLGRPAPTIATRGMPRIVILVLPPPALANPRLHSLARCLVGVPLLSSVRIPCTCHRSRKYCAWAAAGRYRFGGIARARDVRVAMSSQKWLDHAAWAAIPMGHQVRLYRHRANTSPHDSTQPRTFSDNVLQSKRTLLRTRRKRTIEWAFHQEEPLTSVANQRLSWRPSVDSPKLRIPPLRISLNMLKPSARQSNSFRSGVSGRRGGRVLATKRHCPPRE
jgi:hypothetical protein